MWTKIKFIEGKRPKNEHVGQSRAGRVMGRPNAGPLVANIWRKTTPWEIGLFPYSNLELPKSLIEAPKFRKFQSQVTASEELTQN